MKTMKIGNGEYPVIGAIKTEEYGMVPIVDMPLMSDDERNRMCLKDKLKYVYKGDGVSEWCENVDIECPKCEHKVHVASVCADTKIQW